MKLRQMMSSLHQNGFISAEDYPQIVDGATQKHIADAAAELGLDFHYDSLTKTAALILNAGTQDHYTRTDQATILLCWNHLVYRANSKLSQADEDWRSLTSQGRRKLDSDAPALHVTPEFLHTSFPNLYPTTTLAGRALTRLTKKGLLRQRRANEGQQYEATPLLVHVVDDDQAHSIVTGVMRGVFGEISEAPSETEHAILQMIASIEEGHATTAILASRLEMTKRDLEPHLDSLKESGAIQHEFGGERGGHWLIANELEDEEE